ncbi:hypothetical protein D9758_009971 [Tetrapyrgos nigripes]|uniref:Uncharacterized protein n=1 Tax=Tetrapyrgos nigripes TaxID=182062 RepID=A0A8H5FR57_9AGAR|nr:hypothetical protein D9758_009971 [Tetrapyrgos nigripes]
MIVHDGIRTNPGLYPEVEAKEKAVGIVVTLNKGLAGLIGPELSKLGVSAFAYTHNNVTKF